MTVDYLLLIDYYSRWIEISRLERMRSDCVINHLCSMSARYGVPEVLASDNGPQYSSEPSKNFAKEYGLNHVQ